MIINSSSLPLWKVISYNTVTSPSYNDHHITVSHHCEEWSVTTVHLHYEEWSSIIVLPANILNLTMIHSSAWSRDHCQHVRRTLCSRKYPVAYNLMFGKIRCMGSATYHHGNHSPSSSSAKHQYKVIPTYTSLYNCVQSVIIALSGQNN